MPRTSGSSLQARHKPRRASAHGFTLLELLVVMVLVALAVGLVAPASLRGLVASRERAVEADLEAVLAGLPAEAFGGGRWVRVDAGALRSRLPELPQNWKLSVEPPLLYGPTGMAAEAEVVLRSEGRPPLRWRIEALSGRVVRLEAVASR